MVLLNFLIQTFNSPPDSLLESLNKATYIAFDGNSVLLCDSKTVLEFGTSTKKLDTVSYRFYQQHKKHMIGKELYCLPNVYKKYKNHCTLIEKLDDGRYKCRWEG